MCNISTYCQSFEVQKGRWKTSDYYFISNKGHLYLKLTCSAEKAFRNLVNFLHTDIGKCLFKKCMCILELKLDS